MLLAALLRSVMVKRLELHKTPANWEHRYPSTASWRQGFWFKWRESWHFKQALSISFHPRRHLKPTLAPPKSIPSNWSTYHKHPWIREAITETQAGPDQISPWVLKTFAPQCAQILQVIFTQSYNVSGILPEEWKKAHVSPVFKKDNKSLPNNHRPISLTCISCKIMEHVLCSH